MEKKKLTNKNKEEIKEEKKEKNKEKERFDEEIDSYRKTSFFEKIPFMVKAIFLKWWLYGVIYFFVIMGLGSLYGSSMGYIGVIICGLIGGVIFDLVYGNICLLMDDDDVEEIKWVMIYKSKKVWSMIINIIFSLIVFLISSWIIDVVVSCYPKDKTIFVFQEPCTQAIIALIIDEVIVLIKQGIIKLIEYIELKRVLKKKGKK